MTVASGGMARNSSINSETVICRAFLQWADRGTSACHRHADGFRRTDPPGEEPTHPQVSCTWVRRSLAGRTIFLGPKTEQRLVYLILFRLPHAPTRLARLYFD